MPETITVVVSCNQLVGLKGPVDNVLAVCGLYPSFSAGKIIVSSRPGVTFAFGPSARCAASRHGSWMLPALAEGAGPFAPAKRNAPKGLLAIRGSIDLWYNGPHFDCIKISSRGIDDNG